MQEKIKWYQEVLELEPGSKVFFPLARLLSDTGQIDAALQTLQHGISRHPEFIEARLYLIDMLFRHQRSEQCNAQVAELTGLFSSYTGFWQAWGAYLAHNSKDTEISLALSFLAASFQNDKLRLADIFAQGLQASLQGGEPVSAPQNREHAGAACLAPDAAERPEIAVTLDEASGTCPDSAEVLEQDNAVASPHNAVAFPENTVASLDDAQESSYDSIASSENALESLDDAPLSAASSNSPEAASSPSSEESLPAPVLPPLSELVQSLPPTPVFTLQDEESLTSDLTDDSDDDTEERFSLRTRSMAEVLAEQGDFKNALDIYQELVAQATSPEEQLDLQHRISTLTARMGTAQNQSAETSVLPDTAPGKHRLLSLLETLAVRFEAHAQG